ncbi:PASTA domain-containing protein [Demequina capsici]|uniref:PASTA domain-containing protein n=1 Tax=Demequina capsici TaxID=3075620 RepID=A0AA96JCJ6_9MICO|nr:PASTA domain-containing protein [Demequina sp. OYTSA14]WNM23699.1 PASTA domain-containing protein [Demequina sp. OYTSA14]
MNDSQTARAGSAARRVLAVVFVAAVLAGVVLVGRQLSAPITAPSVVGMTVSEAEATLAEAGIHITTDPSYADAMVVAQQPIAGDPWTESDGFVLTYTSTSGAQHIRDIGAED